MYAYVCVHKHIYLCIVPAYLMSNLGGLGGGFLDLHQTSGRLVDAIFTLVSRDGLSSTGKSQLRKLGENFLVVLGIEGRNISGQNEEISTEIVRDN